MDKIIVTCALPYANGPLHVGHIRSTYLPADIYFRYLKMQKRDAAFICASDEHGTPITVTAEKEGKTPTEIADRFHKLIDRDLKSMNIHFDVFSKTSNESNIKRSQEFFNVAKDNGYIFEKEVEQYFCQKCNRFLPDRYVEGICPKCDAEGARGDHCEKCGEHLDHLERPFCLVCSSTPELKTTKHWFFKLTAFNDTLRDYLKRDELPNNVKNYAITWVDKLQDWCITRDMSWGVPVPMENAKDKVLYVWWDAPIGYISATEDWGKKGWEDYWKDGKIVHFIGKDIIYHHALFWPAMLKAHGKYQLPWSIVAGEYLSLEGRKMSTSRNWIIWIDDFLKDYPADYLRYYLTINTPLTSDMDFSWKDFEARVNNELSDVLGNFVHRAMIFTTKFFDGKVPQPTDFDVKDNNAIEKIKAAPEHVQNLIEQFNFMNALKAIMELARVGNQYFNEKEPWKNEENKNAIYVSASIVRSLSILISPFLPDMAQQIWEQLGFEGNVSEQEWSSAAKLIEPGRPVKKPTPLIEKVEIKEKKAEYSDKKVIVDKEIQDKVKSSELSVALAEFKGLNVQKRSRPLEKLKKEAIEKTDYTKVYKTVESYRYMLEEYDKGTEGLSSENLVNFVQDSKMLPNINTLADIYNLVSFKTGLIMGAYDIRFIEGNVLLKVTDGTENFIPIGTSREAKIQPGEYVVADESNKVITRWLTKQHDKVKVDETTQNVVICVQGNKDIPQKKVLETLKEICKLVQEYCGGEYKIIYPVK